MSASKTGNFTYTKFKSHNSKLAKGFELKGGELDKTPYGNMSRGKWSTHTTDVDGLLKAINELGPSEAIGVGICNKGRSGKITASREPKNGAIRRSKENFDFSDFLFIDIDGCGLAIDEVIPALCKLDPNFADATILVLGSSSSVVRKEGETAGPDSGSYHIYISVKSL